MTVQAYNCEPIMVHLVDAGWSSSGAYIQRR